MTAATTERVVRFSASRPQTCTRCAGSVQPGTRGGYAPGAQVLCETCCGGPDKDASPTAVPTPVTAPTPSGDSPEQPTTTPEIEASHLVPATTEEAADESTVEQQPRKKQRTRRQPRDRQQAGSADSGVCATAGEGGAVRRDQSSDQERASATGAAGSHSDPAEQPPPGETAAAEVRAGRVADRHEGDQGNGAGDGVDAVGEAEAGVLGTAGGTVDEHPADSGPAEDHGDRTADPGPDRAGADDGGEHDHSATPGRAAEDALDAADPVRRDLSDVPDPVVPEPEPLRELVRVEPVQPGVPVTGPLVSGRPDISPADFMARPVPAVSVAPPMSGNTAWAATYAREMRSIVEQHANSSERNLQAHLGPSEIGHVCDRQVAGKLAQLPRINHVGDPWASIMGVAGHAWMEELLKAVNARLGRPRFLPEWKVRPTGAFKDHPGTGDGYDGDHNAVIDHKFLGTTTMDKLRRNGLPRHYFVQFLLYMLGFMDLGLPVDRVVLLAWPRTKSSLDHMYVWEHVITDADFAFLENVIAPELEYRKRWAVALITGAAQLSDVPFNPEDECQWCDFYRPASARDGAPGCPGHATGGQ